jgi:myo-inositol-1(or 4)-monophosphatase
VVGTPEPYGPSLEDLLALALDVAEEAGRLLVDERPADRRSLGVSTKSTPTDVVTVMDQRSEALLVARIREQRPDDGVLGEEGTAAAGTSGVRWVLDPVDGTVNYLYGLPGWSVSVAAEVDGEVMVGVVEIPTYGDTFAAVLGAGATRNGRPVGVTTVDRLDQALVATGFSYDATQRRRQAEVVAHVLPRVRDIRRYGSAAVDLCAVAAGRVDAYFERGLQPWDLAAGGLVAREAGALVQGLHGRAPSSAFVLAAGPALFPQLHDLVAPFRPDEDDGG